MRPFKEPENYYHLITKDYVAPLSTEGRLARKKENEFQEFGIRAFCQAIGNNVAPLREYNFWLVLSFEKRLIIQAQAH